MLYKNTVLFGRFQAKETNKLPPLISPPDWAMTYGAFVKSLANTLCATSTIC